MIAYPSVATAFWYQQSQLALATKKNSKKEQESYVSFRIDIFKSEHTEPLWAGLSWLRNRVFASVCQKHHYRPRPGKGGKSTNTAGWEVKRNQPFDVNFDPDVAWDEAEFATPVLNTPPSPSEGRLPVFGLVWGWSSTVLTRIKQPDYRFCSSMSRQLVALICQIWLSTIKKAYKGRRFWTRGRHPVFETEAFVDMLIFICYCTRSTSLTALWGENYVTFFFLGVTAT